MDSNDFQGIEKLTKDLKKAAKTLSKREARFLVDRYYQEQEKRKRDGNQLRSAAESGEPNALVSWMFEQQIGVEDNIRKALDLFSASDPVGQWARSIIGIGPVIAAGLLAYIDIHKAPTVGHIWRYAGLDPTVRWEKGQKRPWNASLKTLCWKIGESFVKQSGHKDDIYGKVYLERKSYEQLKNAQGAYSEQAREKLERFKIGEDTEAYKWYSGCFRPEQHLDGTWIYVEVPAGMGLPMLPPGHLHERSKRYAVKLFLSHLHAVMHEVILRTPAPKPYIITHGGHVHFIAPPNWPMAA